MNPLEEVCSLFCVLVSWLWASVWHGTLLVLGTFVLERALLRRASPSLLASLWTVVLLKFALPVGPVLPLPAFLSSLASHSSIPASLDLTSAVPHTASHTPSAGVALESLGLLAYAAALVRGVMRLVRRQRQLQRWVNGLPNADEVLLGQVKRASAALGVRTPEVRTHTKPGSPCVVGVWQPVLVVPAQEATAMADGSALRQAELLHELAHLKRHDHWVRLLQLAMGVLLFFWPVLAWVNRRLDFYRELACDDEVLRRGPLSGREYARHLLEVHRRLLCVTASDSASVLDMVSSTPQLERRIGMLLKMDKTKRRGLRKGMVLMFGWATLVLSGSARAEPPSEPLALQKDTYGVLDQEVIAGVIKWHLKELQACAEQIQDGPEGRLVVKLTIGVSGSVSEASIDSDGTTITNLDFHQCVLNSIHTWQFPHPCGGPVDLSFPFVFAN